MQINAQFDAPVIVETAALPWQASPMPGVERRMLDRVGGEVARATSIVRYAPGSHFAGHIHAGGEEFIVLEGVFQDEHGDYPAGTYVRNPVGTAHVPRSGPGCTIFVKLWQFDPADQAQFARDLGGLPLTPAAGRPGISEASLSLRADEDVRLEVWDAGASDTLQAAGGFELLVLEGSLDHAAGTLARHDWARYPEGAALPLVAGPQGARVWIKRGHLAAIRVPGEAGGPAT
jgi:quercetin dioxygenase-like cupin family protein